MNEYSSRLANLKQVGMLWFQLISCGHVKIHLGAYIHEMQYFTCLNRLFLQKNAFSCYHWCRRVVAIKPNQAPNRRQFEEFEVKTSTVETMLSSRLMPGEKIGKRMGWVVLGEIWKWRWYWGNRTKKWTVFGVGRTYLISKVLFLGSCAIELTISSDPGWSFHVCCRLMTRGKSELTWLGCVCMFWMNYVVETVFEFRRLYNKSWSFSDMNRFVSNDCIYVYWIYVYYCTWFNQ